MGSGHDIDTPSPWIERWAPLVKPGAAVLDLACGHGRHARYFAARGCSVVAVDRDQSALATLAEIQRVQVKRADLEGEAWPFAPACFDAIVVTNYLHRPLFASLAAALRPEGVLLYETFMCGNERFGKPANPAFLLRPNELFEAFAGRLRVAAFEQGEVLRPKPALIQRLCAIQRVERDITI